MWRERPATKLSNKNLSDQHEVVTRGSTQPSSHTGGGEYEKMRLSAGEKGGKEPDKTKLFLFNLLWWHDSY